MTPMILYETAFLTTLCALPYVIYQRNLLYYTGIVIGMYLLLKLIRRRRSLGVVDSTNKAVLISGCDSGFGLAAARRLSECGFRVFAGCLNANSAGAVTLKIKYNDNLHVLPLDITQDESVNKALEFVRANLGGACLWGLVNNAGICAYGDLELESLDAYKRIYDVNLFGTLRLTKTFLPLVRKAKGRIVILSSLAGILTYPGFSCYGSSKAALESISDCLRMEMAKFGVKVSVLEPTCFLTNVASEENVERMIADRETYWNTCNDDVKSVYSKEYAINIIRAAIKLTTMIAAKSLNPVVQAIEECLTSSNPVCRQKVQANKIDLGYIVFSILSKLPERISDWAFLLINKHGEMKLLREFTTEKPVPT